MAYNKVNLTLFLVLADTDIRPPIGNVSKGCVWPKSIFATIGIFFRFLLPMIWRMSFIETLLAD